MVKKFGMLMVSCCSVLLIAASVLHAAPADQPRTGQTTVYSTGDDGGLQKGVAWPDPRFTVGTGAEADCVTDNLTGLMWVKSPDSTTRTWADALTYADGLSLCGYTDWRLPNRKELRSLVNYGQSNSATWLNTQGFSNVRASSYWSSTTYANTCWWRSKSAKPGGGGSLQNGFWTHHSPDDSLEKRRDSPYS